MGEKWIEEVAKAGGWEQHALEDLRKTLENKEAREALTTIGKVDKDTWGMINSSVRDLKDFVGAGGISSLKTEIKEQMILNIMQPLAPLINEFAPIIGKIYEALQPLIDRAMPVLTWISDVLVAIIDWIVNAIEWIINALRPDWEGSVGDFDIREFFFPSAPDPMPGNIARINDYEPGY